MTGAPVYLDYQATTPVDPFVREAMLPFLGDLFGNPHSSDHSFGWEAARAIKDARASVATLINADDDKIVFTSGATESCNLALRGVANHSGNRQRSRSVRRGVTGRHDAETLSMSGGSCIFSGLAALEQKRPGRAGAMQ